LQAILHDWGDQQCQRILSCVKRDAPKASILVIESPRPDNNQYDIAKLVDIWVMLATGDGKERSRNEFIALFAQVGYTIKTTYLLPNLLRVMRLDLVQASQCA